MTDSVELGLTNLELQDRPRILNTNIPKAAPRPRHLCVDSRHLGVFVSIGRQPAAVKKQGPQAEAEAAVKREERWPSAVANRHQARTRARAERPACALAVRRARARSAARCARMHAWRRANKPPRGCARIFPRARKRPRAVVRGSEPASMVQRPPRPSAPWPGRAGGGRAVWGGH